MSEPITDVEVSLFHDLAVAINEPGEEYEELIVRCLAYMTRKHLVAVLASLPTLQRAVADARKALKERDAMLEKTCLEREDLWRQLQDLKNDPKEIVKGVKR